MNEVRILVLDLLDILKKYSNREHPLTQQRIIQLLENKYGYHKLRRQTIQRNIERMIDHYELDNRVIRLTAEDDYYENDLNAIEDTKRRITDIYYHHKLSNPELILIIDSILFSKQIPVAEREELIKKLESLSSKHFNSRMGNISSISATDKKQSDTALFTNIQQIDETISESKKISFNYLGYKVEKNKIILEPRKNAQGKIREYVINPYYMAASNGRYYLICNHDSYDSISTYRIDRIANIKILNEKRRSQKEVEGLGENFNLNDYMVENIYMFGGESEYVKLSVQKIFLDEFLDWFKVEDTFVQENEDKVIVRVKSNRMAMRRWALRYALYVRVLSPQDLANEIKEDLQRAIENYHLE